MKYVKHLFLIITLVVVGCTVQPDYEEMIDVSHYENKLVDLEPDNYTTPKKTLFYNFHCTASQEGKDLDGKFFIRFWRNYLGWKNPGYNGLILLDGTIDTLKAWNWDGMTSPNEITNGVRGVNSVSLNFAYVGGVDKNLVSKDTRTPAQKRTIELLVHTAQCSDHSAEIMGHRDHVGVKKDCPSFDIRGEFLLPPDINSEFIFIEGEEEELKNRIKYYD